MKVMIGTPAYGGMLHANYVSSIITTTRGFLRDGVDFVVYMISNESLINRARNTIAEAALSGGIDKLVFIDADIGWSWDNIAHLLNSDKPIIGGTYSLKNLPIRLNFNPLPNHFDVFEEVINDKKTYSKTLDKYEKYREKYASENHEVEVCHIPTGFMSIDLNVVRQVLDKVPTYTHHDVNTGDSVKMYDLFPVKVTDGILESEDWAFCTMMRKLGIPIYLNTSIVLPHTGTFTFI